MENVFSRCVSMEKVYTEWQRGAGRSFEARMYSVDLSLF